MQAKGRPKTDGAVSVIATSLDVGNHTSGNSEIVLTLHLYSVVELRNKSVQVTSGFLAGNRKAWQTRSYSLNI